MVIIDNAQKTTLNYIDTLTRLEQELANITRLDDVPSDMPTITNDNSQKPFVDEFDDHDIREQEQLRIILFDLSKTLRAKVVDLEKLNSELQEKISQKNRSFNEIAQEKELSSEMLSIFSNTINELKNSSNKMQNILSTNKHEANEQKQLRLLSYELNKTLKNKLQELEDSKNELESKLFKQSIENKELEQEKIILHEISDSEKINIKKSYKKFYVLIVIISVTTSVGFVGYSVYENQILITTTSHLLRNYNSNYLIQNLQGDTVNTWVAWHLVTGQTLHIDIMNEAGLSPDRIFAVKDAIISTQTVTLDDSLLHKGPPGTSSIYYKGWEGALDAASASTEQFYIPQKFDLSDSPKGAGEILIKLTNDQNPDGLSGYTKSVADGNQILKTTITIYNADQLSANQLGAITRHEFGHAMGLAHSSAPEDLMHATIETDYPYISGCDVDAIKLLYNNGQKSEVVCQK